MSTTTQVSLKDALPAVLSSIPADWRGTTYNNSDLLGRTVFSERLSKLISSGTPITTDAVYNLGISEDYFRVSSNMNTTLELALSEEMALPIEQIFTFGSKTMPILAVGLTASGPVDLFCGSEAVPFTAEHLTLLKNLGVDLHQHSSVATGPTAGRTTIALQSAVNGAAVDGIIAPLTLYITNPHTIEPHDILVIRKRFATPMTNPMSEEWMQKIAGVEVTANQNTYTPESLAGFHAHLQTLSGTAVNTGANPVIFAAGLPALTSMWFTMIGRGGCNVLMASTAYGGSSECTDLIEKFCPTFKKTTYDVQGAAAMIESIKLRLDELSSKPDELLATTVLLSEVPTNPDMKVPDIKALADLIVAYKKKTGKDFVFLVDTTFAPGSKVLAKLEAAAPDLTAMTFISLSKSLSRGHTTAGAIVANGTEGAISILEGIRTVSRSVLDTNAKQDQLCFLCENHTGVEKRLTDAYAVHVAVGDHLVAEVKAATGVEMPLCTVSPENAREGFTSSTFSFNLPTPKGASNEKIAGLAQEFVDLLCLNENFKPCVSFGQDNGITYCTVPATSTQGAIKEEDKAKQAIGGVQLTRLSFPPSCDLEVVKRCISEAVAAAFPEASRNSRL
jgi:cysteine synthase A